MLTVARPKRTVCLGRIGEHHLRPHEDILLKCQRGDPGAEVGGNGHACLDRSKGRAAWLADERQKDVLDGHRDLLRRQNRPALVGTPDPRQARELRSVGRRQALTEVKDWPRSASMDYPDRGVSRFRRIWTYQLE